jgi:hypothetical protein
MNIGDSNVNVLVVGIPIDVNLSTSSGLNV